MLGSTKTVDQLLNDVSSADVMVLSWRYCEDDDRVSAIYYNNLSGFSIMKAVWSFTFLSTTIITIRWIPEVSLQSMSFRFCFFLIVLVLFCPCHTYLSNDNKLKGMMRGRYTLNNSQLQILQSSFSQVRCHWKLNDYKSCKFSRQIMLRTKYSVNWWMKQVCHRRG